MRFSTKPPLSNEERIKDWARKEEMWKRRRATAWEYAKVAAALAYGGLGGYAFVTAVTSR